jgi:hypothetical protein
MAKLKPRNGGTWTESRFHSFVKGALRAASAKWGPRFACIKRANVGYGKYKCDQCGEVGPPTLPPPEGKSRRIQNIIADHIDPVIDVSWDELIKSLFVEVEGFQAICHKCHSIKTKEERDIAKQRRDNDKNL